MLLLYKGYIIDEVWIKRSGLRLELEFRDKIMVLFIFMIIANRKCYPLIQAINLDPKLNPNHNT